MESEYQWYPVEDQGKTQLHLAHETEPSHTACLAHSLTDVISCVVDGFTGDQICPKQLQNILHIVSQSPSRARTQVRDGAGQPLGAYHASIYRDNEAFDPPQYAASAPTKGKFRLSLNLTTPAEEAYVRA